TGWPGAPGRSGSAILRKGAPAVCALAMLAAFPGDIPTPASAMRATTERTQNPMCAPDDLAVTPASVSARPNSGLTVRIECIVGWELLGHVVVVILRDR